MSKRNIALIGAGYWGKNLLRVFDNLGVLKIVCDIDNDILRLIKREYPGIRTSTEFNDVLKDKEIKAIVIATPVDTHYFFSKKSLIARKDVLVEKPFVLKINQAQELLSLARKKQRVLMVDHTFLYHPALLKIKELIKKGKLGKIYFLNSNRLNLGIIRTKEDALWSITPHDISMIIELIGELPEKVSATGQSYFNKKNIDFVSAQLNFKKNKISANIFASWLNPLKERKLTIVGSKGMLVFDDMAKDALKFFRYKIKPIKNQKTGYIKIKITKTEENVIDVSKEEPLKNSVKHFLECVEKRKIPKSGSIEATNVVKILTACEKSIKYNGKPIRV